ncbi:type 11 methyltransferase [Acidovorax sp. KKS102]|nr:type 11 methyltransferase [Acidovorax sp. KKS102]
MPSGRYSYFSPDVLLSAHQRQRATLNLLASKDIQTLRDLDLIEVGCGNGGNLLELLLLGATPERLSGNELLDERLRHARSVLPDAVRLWPGNAADLALGESSFDIVYQSTVFSSILDDALQESISAAMWRWLRPGGAVLWYDFTYNNPCNPDVRGVSLRRVQALFPQGRITSRRVTLAPPLARVLVRCHPALYGLFNCVPWLRTHVLCWIEKQ